MRRSNGKRHQNVCLLILSLSLTSGVFADSEVRVPKRLSCQSHGSFLQKRQVKGLPLALQSTGVFFNHCDQGVIWATQSPVEETLVIRSKRPSLIVENGKQRVLKGYAGQLMSRVIHAMMNGQLASLQKDFEIRQDNPNAWSLRPKKSRLRRALQRIEFTLEGNRVRVSMLDRDELRTDIELDDQPVSDPELTSCAQLTGLLPSLCGLLLPGETLDAVPAAKSVDSSDRG